MQKFIFLLLIFFTAPMLIANESLKITPDSALPNNAPEIFKAVHNKEYKKVSKLLKNTQTPCQEMQYKYNHIINSATAFDYAIRTGNTKIVKEFLPYIKNITKPICLHKPSLFYAVIINDIAMMKFLIHHGADINYVSNYNTKNSALEEALMLGKIRSAQFLIDNGAKISQESQFKLLKHAVIALNIDTVKFLIANKIDLNYTDKNGDTIMHIIAMGDIDKNLKSLEQFSQSSYAKKIPGYTQSIVEKIAQLKSKWNNYPKIIQLLITNGADLKIKNNDGKTPYSLAKENDIKQILPLLESIKR